MAHASDLLHLGEPFIELQSVDSTNNYARSLINQQSARHGVAVFAHDQLTGKGQRGKQWISEKDAGLVLSIIIEPGIVEITEPFQLTVCVALAARQLFSSRAGGDTTIKWPNDIYWRDKKAGGILIENIISAGNEKNAASWKWAIVGVGMNVNQSAFPAELSDAVSLQQITGKTYDPIALAKELCHLMGEQLKSLRNHGYSSLHAAFNDNLYKKDQVIRLKKDNRSFEARLKGVSASGKLIVAHNLEEEFGFDEVEWMKEREA